MTIDSIISRLVLSRPFGHETEKDAPRRLFQMDPHLVHQRYQHQSLVVPDSTDKPTEVLG